MDTSDQTLQVRVAGAKKRRRTVSERLEIVEETLLPGASVSMFPNSKFTAGLFEVKSRFQGMSVHTTKVYRIGQFYSTIIGK